MPDFPTLELDNVPVSVQTFSSSTLLGQLAAVRQVQFGAGGTWTTANTAVYIPVTLGAPMLAQQIAVQVITQSGNLDVGVYTEQGARLVSTGSTAVAAAGLQALDIADTWLAAGTYFIAMNVDNTTAAFLGGAGFPVMQGRASGVLQQAVGSVTLPASSTFSTFTTKFIPAILLTGVSVV